MRRGEELRNRDLFDGMAHAYHEWRQGYPPNLFDEALDGMGAKCRVLEVGSGTGKATREFLARDCAVHCVDPSHAMMNLLHRLYENERLTSECCYFEHWQPSPNPFDIVAAAQAFHWVPTAEAYSNAAAALRDEGRLVLFWNVDEPTNPFDDELDALYRSIAPQIIAERRPRIGEFVEAQTAEISASGFFTDVRIHTYPWRRDCTAEMFLGFLSTCSDHVALRADVRSRLEKGIRALFRVHSGSVSRKHTAVLFLADRRTCGAEEY